MSAVHQIHVVFLEIEHPLRRGVGADEVSAGRMDDALRLSRGAGGVEDVEHVLRIHPLGLADVGRVLHQAVVPVVAPFLDVNWDGRTVQALDDDDVLDRRRAFERFVRHLLQRHDLAAPPAAVRGHEQRRLRVVDAIAQRLGAEAAEDHRMHGADARAREHRDRQLRDERQVERHAVAALDAERLQDVGELADLAIEIEVGQRPAVARLAFPDERRLVPARSARVAIDAVDAGVQRAADEPLRVRRLPVEHARPRREPLELRAKPAQKAFGIPLGARVDVLVAHVGLRAKRLGRRKRAVLPQQIGDLWRSLRVDMADQNLRRKRRWRLGRSAESRQACRCGRTRRRARRRASRRRRRRRAARRNPKTSPNRRVGPERLEHRRALQAAGRGRCGRSRPRAAPGAVPSRCSARCETIEPDDGADDPGEQPGQRASADR